MENTHFNPLFEVGVITLTVCEFRRMGDEDQHKLAQMCVRRRRVHKKPGSDQLISLNITLSIIIQNENLTPGQCWSVLELCLTLKNASVRCYC